MSYFFTAAVIGFLSLDTTVAFQMLISQPLFASTILGWLLGDIQLGFEIGVLMQLLWLSTIPAGAAKFPEGNIASMVTVAIVLYFNPTPYPNSILLIAFLIGLVVSYCGTLLTILDRKINGSFFKWAVDAAEKAGFHRITLLEIISVLIYFLMMAFLAYGALLFADYIMKIVQPFFTETIETKLIVLKPTILGIGIALTFPMIYRAFNQLRTL